MDASYYIRKAEIIAQDYPENGIAKMFLKILDEEGRGSQETLSAAKSLIDLKGKL